MEPRALFWVELRLTFPLTFPQGLDPACSSQKVSQISGLQNQKSGVRVLPAPSPHRAVRARLFADLAVTALPAASD